MDVLSLSKASKALKTIQDFDSTVVAPLAESRFPTVDARLDWIEGQATKARVAQTKNLDLTQGTFTNTEIQNGKLQLKFLGTVGAGYTSDVVPKMTSNNAPSPMVIAYSTVNSGYAAWKAFSDTNTDYYDSWTTLSGTTTGWISVDFGTNKKIAQYTLQTRTDATGQTSMAKSWTFEGSNDNLNWTVLDTRNNETGWGILEKRTYTFSNSLNFRYYRLNVSLNNGGSSYLTIGEIEMMESAMQNTYAPSGTYESPVIDLGADFTKLKTADVVSSIHVGVTNAVIQYVSSDDGNTFSAYQAIDPNALVQKRYIKFQATLTSTPQAVVPVDYQYDQNANNTVTTNQYTLTNGDLKLKTSYSYPMSITSSDADSKIIQTTISKSQFSKLTKLEVK